MKVNWQPASIPARLLAALTFQQDSKRSICWTYLYTKLELRLFSAQEMREKGAPSQLATKQASWVTWFISSVITRWTKSALEGLSAEGGVEVVLGDVEPRGGAAVPAGEGPKGLQPPRDRRYEALLAAQVAHHQLVQRRARLPHQITSRYIT